MANEMSGKGGGITWTNASTTIKSWTLSYVGDALETSNFDDSSGGRTYVAGLTGWSGSLEALYSTANTVVPNSSGALILRTTTGTAGVWSGTALMTAMDITAPRDGLVTQGYTFQGTGYLKPSS